MQPRFRRNIKHFVVLGDSLSDRGMLWDRDFLGIFHVMRDWSGLVGSSPDKRFTNGYVWLDYLAEEFATKFKSKEKENPELYLENDQRIMWEKHDFVRSFAEGGVAAHQYIFAPQTTFIGFVTRLILRTLGGMRDLLLADDKNLKISESHKQQTLVIDWTGANDLVTVNQKPTIEEARLAVKSRIKNTKKLIKQGYQNFQLFDLPDLSLTPRFQKLTEQEKIAAQASINEFNKLLSQEIEKLKITYPQCQIDVYSIGDRFKEIYTKIENGEDKEMYPFDKQLLKQSLSTSNMYKELTSAQREENRGYMFYDDIHPTTEMHKILAGDTREQIKQRYKVFSPNLKCQDEMVSKLLIDENKLIEAFKNKYTAQFKKDCHKPFGLLCHSNIGYRFAEKEFSLTQIINHALNENGKRAFRVLHSLGWIDEKGELCAMNVPALQAAYNNAILKHSPSDKQAHKFQTNQ